MLFQELPLLAFLFCTPLDLEMPTVIYDLSVCLPWFCTFCPGQGLFKMDIFGAVNQTINLKCVIVTYSQWKLFRNAKVQRDLKVKHQTASFLLHRTRWREWPAWCCPERIKTDSGRREVWKHWMMKITGEDKWDFCCFLKGLRYELWTVLLLHTQNNKI